VKTNQVKNMLNNTQIRRVLDTIEDMFPDAHCELRHSNPLELTVAVILSAQCTDEKVNQVTPQLFEKYQSPEDYAAVELEELQNDIRSIGLFRNKAKSIKNMACTIIERHNGQIPESYDELVALPGVGRKTANVILATVFGHPAIAVDTHVERVSKRLGICRWKDTPLQVEKTLMRKVPREEWAATHHRLIFFGRYHCKAMRPQCEICPLLDLCREGKKRLKVKTADLS
jgi:endonuclease III